MQFRNSSKVLRVDFLYHSWFNVFHNKMVFSEFGQDRCEGNGTEVLVNTVDGPLFWDQDYISLFPRWRKAGFMERGVEDLRAQVPLRDRSFTVLQ